MNDLGLLGLFGTGVAFGIIIGYILRIFYFGYREKLQKDKIQTKTKPVKSSSPQTNEETLHGSNQSSRKEEPSEDTNPIIEGGVKDGKDIIKDDN